MELLEVTITHNLADATEVAELFRQRLIALDWGRKGPNPNEYTGRGYTDVTLFHTMRQHGAAVIAAYKGQHLIHLIVLLAMLKLGRNSRASKVCCVCRYPRLKLWIPQKAFLAISLRVSVPSSVVATEQKVDLQRWCRVAPCPAMFGCFIISMWSGW